MENSLLKKSFKIAGAITLVFGLPFAASLKQTTGEANMPADQRLSTYLKPENSVTNVITVEQVKESEPAKKETSLTDLMRPTFSIPMPY